MGLLPAADADLEAVGRGRPARASGRGGPAARVTRPLASRLAPGHPVFATVLALVALVVPACTLVLAGAPAVPEGHLRDGLRSPRAQAHRLGRPVPEITVLPRPTEQITWLLSVRVADDDSRDPVRGATVRVVPSMAGPHRMVLPVVTLEESPFIPGLYSGAVTFPHPARWTLAVEVSGPVAPVRQVVDVDVAPAGSASRDSAAGVAGLVTTAAEIRLAAREWATLAVLAAHLSTGAAWVGGLALAGARPPAPGQLRRIVALSWGAAAVMVATGAYNSIYAMPVRVEWFRGGVGTHLAAFARVPFGTGYGLLLLAKHALIAALLAVLVGLTLLARRPGASPARAALWLRVAAGLGAIVLLQSVGLGYLHRLIAHF